MPSELEWRPEEEFNAQEGGPDAAAAVPADVAASLRQFVAVLTTPETELEQQLLEATRRWAARFDPPAPVWPTASRNPCLAGSSMNNSRCSSPRWSGGSGGGAGDPFSPIGPGGNHAAAGAGPGPSSSGRSSEEGSSAAWRLCAWLQRHGWPAQHRASFRSGCSGGGGGAGVGWRFASGHEFVLVYPHQCTEGGGGLVAAAPAAPAAADGPSDAPGGGRRRRSSDSFSSDGGECFAADMACDSSALGLALVVDPEFSMQFALASPTPRYQAVLSLLPRVFVGTFERLQRLVEWVCQEMQGSFQGRGSGLPPWRSLDHVLSKWRLEAFSDDGGAGGGGGSHALLQRQQAQQQAAASPQQQGVPQDPQQQQQQQFSWQAAAPDPPFSAPACGVAFSAQQQQAMRSLLLQPSPPPEPLPMQQQAGGGHLTASSSCSSMDATPTLGPAAPAPAPAAAAPTVAAATSASSAPRSLLTRELQELALAAEAAASQQAQGQGQCPASTILSLAYGSAASPGW